MMKSEALWLSNGMPSFATKDERTKHIFKLDVAVDFWAYCVVGGA